MLMERSLPDSLTKGYGVRMKISLGLWRVGCREGGNAGD